MRFRRQSRPCECAALVAASAEQIKQLNEKFAAHLDRANVDGEAVAKALLKSKTFNGVLDNLTHNLVYR